MAERPSWDDYFLGLAHNVAERSTCMRRKVGALLVKDRRILTTGYNGAPSRMKHCDATGCMREKLKVPSGERHELCRGLHAEQNALIQAAVHGVNSAGATLYCTHHPCGICAKMLLNAGIERVVYSAGYPDDMAKEIFTNMGIRLVQMLWGIS